MPNKKKTVPTKPYSDALEIYPSDYLSLDPESKTAIHMQVGELWGKEFERKNAKKVKKPLLDEAAFKKAEEALDMALGKTKYVDAHSLAVYAETVDGTEQGQYEEAFAYIAKSKPEKYTFEQKSWRKWIKKAA